MAGLVLAAALLLPLATTSLAVPDSNAALMQSLQQAAVAQVLAEVEGCLKPCLHGAVDALGGG